MAKGDTVPSSSQVSQSVQPWKPAQEPIKQLMQEGMTLFESGVGAQPYPGNTTIPLADQTVQGLDDAMAKAMGGSEILDTGFKTTGEMVDYLKPIAMGDFSDDTTFSRALGSTLDDVQDRVANQFSMEGRYGGGVNQDVLARTLGETSDRIKLNRQDWATSNLGSMIDRTGPSFQSTLMPAEVMQGVGGTYENLAAALKNDEIRLHGASQTMPWENLARAMAIATGAGALGSQTQGTTKAQLPRQTPSFGQSLLGTGVSLLGGLLL